MSARGDVTSKRNTQHVEESIDFLREKILQKCHEMYVQPELGLLEIAKELKLECNPPKKKINILLIGNHSVGKSSFINWYIGEHVQKTGVAIETQGFSFIVHGKKRDTLCGETTLRLLPYLNFLREKKGLLDYLNCEVSTSRERHFPLVTLIDTPGLVDGGMVYPFDVNDVIVSLADVVDLALVFFDPVGQALCKRTLDIAELLNHRCPEKIRFYLSKADDAGTETDRQRVMMQIVQELCKRPGLNKQGFDMPCIYIPNPNKSVKCMNQIESLCTDIRRTVNLSVQNVLQKVDTDCKRFSYLLEALLQSDKYYKRKNFQSTILRSVVFTWCLFSLCCLIGPIRDSFKMSLHLAFGPVFGDVPFYLALNVFGTVILIVLVGLSPRLFPIKERLNSSKLSKMYKAIHTAILPEKEALFYEYLKSLSEELE